VTTPWITVIGTGGTISSVSSDSLEALDNPEFCTKLNVAEVLERVPEMLRAVQPVPIPVHPSRRPSRRPAARGYRAILIHHGSKRHA
jgi:L-asparaginase/Glu-tRNA(Gln) amidotransferase subunit D